MGTNLAYQLAVIAILRNQALRSLYAPGKAGIAAMTLVHAEELAR